MTFASLQNKRIVVTGSSSGIGRAIALECARAGAEIILHCRQSTERAEATAAEIGRLGSTATIIRADISSSEQRMQLVNEAFNAGPVDAVVNNAGADLLTTELKNVDYSTRLNVLLQTDVVGSIELSKAFGQRFLNQRSGCVLNIGWDQSDRGMEGDSGELFSAAKNAVMGFSRSLALTLAPHVRVNCIAPGWIQTAWGETTGEYWQQRVLRETPLKRWGQPEDVAAMARFLLSDSASYITGQVINVNGGAVR